MNNQQLAEHIANYRAGIPKAVADVIADLPKAPPVEPIAEALVDFITTMIKSSITLRDNFKVDIFFDGSDGPITRTGIYIPAWREFVIWCKIVDVHARESMFIPEAAADMKKIKTDKITQVQNKTMVLWNKNNPTFQGKWHGTAFEVNLK